jgi:uncharacterized protein (DUF1501 family)
MSLTRRQFMVGCSAGIAALAGGRVGKMVFANELSPQAGGNDEILVVVFLRGGCDGLSLVSPFDDRAYAAARGSIALKESGATSVLKLDPKNNSFTSSLGLHYKAAPLKELYDAGKLAIVHACGLNDDTRSHFDAMDYMERGTPGNKNTPSGWLARHLQLTHPDTLLPSVSAGSANPSSLLGDSGAVAMSSISGFNLSAHWRYNNNDNTTMYDALRQIYSGEGVLQKAGQRTLETIDSFRAIDDPNYTPDYPYPNNSFGNSLKLIAQTIKLDLGLRVATADLGSWDTHENQGVGENGYYSNLVDTLARGLHAFYNDLPNHTSKLTVVVMSEFGRRLGVNASNGTDHGHGNVMFVLGGKANGGKVYGKWPGLEDLDQNQDLRITTDYRTVLSEILMRRMGNNKLGAVFPGLSSYEPLGVTGSASEDRDPYQIYLPTVRR